ncbi:MAG: WG repeat-containing protein [Zoogloeaceae bacterium]|jgi:hypothetical protein|nr:WG repeat-containing protein [Zoogloeaceae bacterium]
MNQHITQLRGSVRLAALLALVAGLLASSLPAMATETGSPAKNLALIWLNGKHGYFNSQGEMVIPPKFSGGDNDADFDNINGRNFSDNGLKVVMEGGKWGYINAQGEWVIPPKFYWAVDFSANGLALVTEKKGGKAGYINAEGTWIIPPRFARGGSFAANGLAWAEKVDGKVGYINAKGEWVIPPRFDGADEFDDNLAAVRKGEKWGYINEQGEWVVSPRFDVIEGFFDNGIATVEENWKSGYFNVREGKWVFSPPMSESDREAGRRLERKLRFIKYQKLQWNMENGKSGYVNDKDEWVIPPRFEEAMYFVANGLAWVKENGKKGYINVKGEIVVYIDKICGFEVLKNARGEITWPKKTAEQICKEQEK